METFGQNNHKLSVLEKCAYGAGDLACNLFWGISVVAAMFYTDYFGISAAAAGTMMMIVSYIDLIFDVFIGAAADRSNSKWGKFRPWILYGFVPFVVIGFFTFYSPDFADTYKIIYAYVTYLLFRIMYSVVNVPYGALLGVISDDPKVRDEVSAYRNVGAQIGNLVSYSMVFKFAGMCKEHFEVSASTGFSYVVFIYAIIAAILLFSCFYFTRERVTPVKEENNNLMQDIKDIVTNKQWICLAIAGISLILFTSCHNTMVAYYAKYYIAQMVANPDSVDAIDFVISGRFLGIELDWELFYLLISGMGTILTILGTMMIQPIVRKYGKKETWIACFALSSIITISLAFIPKENLTTIILLNWFFSLIIGPTGYIMWSMYADVADDAEVATGRRATGLIYSSATISQKFGYANANSLPLFALASIGFVANDINMTAETQETVKNIFALVPLAGSILGIVALLFYNINEKKIVENSKKLAEMKANNNNSDVVAQ
ncbi:MAG: MFS transporter [Paludibacteraceae bacterium]|nr:MFS transporter [Paludibacteraceae bacterium]